MLAKRIIPCLDVDAGRVVKGVNFMGLIDALNNTWVCGPGSTNDAQTEWSA